MKIFYEQDSILKLSDFLKKNYFCKKVLLMISDGVKDKYLNIIVNELNKAQSPFKINELKEEYEVVLCVGGSKICNEAKIYCSHHLKPLIVIPTIPSTPIFFNDEYYLNVDNLLSVRKGVRASCVLIDEKIIWQAPLYLIKRSALFAMSYVALLYENDIKVLLKNEQKMVELKQLLDNLDLSIEKVARGEREGKLEIMDFMLEVSKFNLDNSLIISLARLLDLSENFDEESVKLRKIKNVANINSHLNLNVLLASDLLINCYKEMFSLKRIEIKNMPNYQKIKEKLKNFGIFSQNLVNFNVFDTIVENKPMFFKLNIIKNKCKYLAEIYKDKIKHALNLFLKTKAQIPNLDVCFNAISVLPVISSQAELVNVLSCVGVLD